MFTVDVKQQCNNNATELVAIATLMLYFHYDGTMNDHSDLSYINLRLLVQMGACLKQKEKYVFITHER